MTEVPYHLGKMDGIQEGLEKGLEQGRMEEQIKIARSLKQSGLSDEEIHRYTGVSLLVIRAL